MAAKRARVAPRKTELLCHVIDPTKLPDYDKRTYTLYEIAGRGAIRLFGFKTPAPMFWHLWSRIPEVMLRKETESAPFVDFEAPLASMHCTFVQCPWTAEYDHLRARFETYQLKYALLVADKKINDARDSIEDLKRKVEEAQASLEAKREELVRLEEKRTELEALVERPQ